MKTIYSLFTTIFTIWGINQIINENPTLGYLWVIFYLAIITAWLFKEWELYKKEAGL